MSASNTVTLLIRSLLSSHKGDLNRVVLLTTQKTQLNR